MQTQKEEPKQGGVMDKVKGFGSFFMSTIGGEEKNQQASKPV